MNHALENATKQPFSTSWTATRPSRTRSGDSTGWVSRGRTSRERSISGTSSSATCSSRTSGAAPRAGKDPRRTAGRACHGTRCSRPKRIGNTQPGQIGCPPPRRIGDPPPARRSWIGWDGRSQSGRLRRARCAIGGRSRPGTDHPPAWPAGDSRTFPGSARHQGRDDVFLDVEQDEIRIYSRATALRQVQERVAKYVPSDVSLVETLIAERRREALKEEAGNG